METAQILHSCPSAGAEPAAAPPSPVITEKQATLVDRITLIYRGCLRAACKYVEFYFLTGIYLLALKATCDHGNSPGAAGFMKLREQFLPHISKSLAARCMDFAALCLSKFPAEGNIAPEQNLPTNGTLTPEQLRHVIDAASDAAAGKSLTEFYAELRSCRPAKSTKRPRKKKINSTKQKRQGKQQRSRFEIATRAIQDVIEKGDLRRLSPGQRDLAVALGNQWTEALAGSQITEKLNKI